MWSADDYLNNLYNDSLKSHINMDGETEKLDVEK